jgi:putative flippase GtrA
VLSLLRRPGIQQLIKFCIVGASSFTIDLGLFNLLYQKYGWSLPAAKTLSFCLAVVNGFYWNRRWTFQAGAGDAKAQYPKFLLTNTVGLVLNLSIMTGAILLAGHLGWIHANKSTGEILELIVRGEGRAAFSPLTVNAATVVATVCVTTWNFTAARLWTFKQPVSPAAEPAV